jgi:hypothetical protein
MGPTDPQECRSNIKPVGGTVEVKVEVKVEVEVEF